MSPYEVIADWSTIGWPLLVNHLWQATLFSLLALGAATLLRRAPARARFFVWLVALTKFALPSAFLFFLAAQAGINLALLSPGEFHSQTGALAVSPLLSPVTRSAIISRTTESPSQGAEPPGVVFTETTSDWSDHLNGLITCLWLTGCVVLLVSWLRRSHALSVSIRKGREISSGREADALRSVRSRFRMRRKVRLVSTAAVSEPGVWGVWRPVVLLPDGVTEQLDDAELEAVLMHELSHIKRWDNLVGNLQRALCCLFWFHPVVWIIDRRLLAEREQACDDIVVRLGGATEVYARGITKVCRYCLGQEVAGLAKATGSDLKKRIERIISNRAGKKMSALQAVTLTFVPAVALTLSIASGEGNISNHIPIRVDGLMSTIDTRFEAMDMRLRQGPELNSRQSPLQAHSESRGEDATGRLPGKELKSRAAQPNGAAELPNGAAESSEKASATTESVEPQTGAATTDAAPFESQIYPPEEPTAPYAGKISAAVVKASDINYGDLRKFIGRYEVDPNKAENFVLDITLEGGELWLKPSHGPKRRLIRKSETDFSDAYYDYDLTCILDGRDRVVGLRLNTWGRDVVARKLSLPQPSLRGNITFRLSGFPDAKVVAVAGDFNNWNQSQFLFAKEGRDWVCRVNLPAGTYQYKFIVDGNWLTDPNNPKIIHDLRGFENSLLRAE